MARDNISTLIALSETFVQIYDIISEHRKESVERKKLYAMFPTYFHT